MTSRDARRIKASYEETHQRIAEELGLETQNKIILEAYSNAVRDLLSLEDEGWNLIQGSLNEEAKGLSLSDAQEVTSFLERQVKLQGGTLGRALRLKNNHAFGRGFKFERKEGKIAPRYQAIIDDPENWACVFSNSAAKEMNRVFFTSGNLFVLFDRKTRQFQRLSVELNVVNFFSDEENPSRIKYFLRQWTTRDDLTTAATTTHQEWVPTATYALTKPKFPDTIKTGNENIRVNKDAVIIDKRINRDNGDIWGVPDAFSAAPWATLYSNYLRDGAKLAHALAAISYLVKAKTERAAKSAGAKVSNGRVAQAAITGPETEITSIPRAGAINLYEGRPLQAQIASNLDVSTTGIASDPGPGGSYASESALSQPEQMAALSRQEDFSDFYAMVFRVMGADDVYVQWNRLDSDPVHRQLQSLGLAYTMGGINQEELRQRSLELLDVVPTTDKLPEPNEFTGSKASTLQANLNDDPDASSSGLPSQGNSGAVGSLDDAGNSSKNDDRDAGAA